MNVLAVAAGLTRERQAVYADRLVKVGLVVGAAHTECIAGSVHWLLAKRTGRGWGACQQPTGGGYCKHPRSPPAHGRLFERFLNANCIARGRFCIGWG